MGLRGKWFIMRRGLRFTAVIMVVLVALTGFKSKSRGSRGHGGGGCSSSSSHQSGSGSGSSTGGYSDSDDSDSGTGSGGSYYRGNGRYSTPSAGGTSSAAPEEPEATVVSCVGPGDPTATVKVRNRSRSSAVYVVDMDFDDKSGREVTGGSATVRVPAGESKRVEVTMDDPALAGGVARCEVVSVS